MPDFETKDSGERALFESGMQRDTEEGKPRFDLIVPLDVPYEEQMITRLAALYGRGAVKYESRNWEQANSRAEIDRMKSSAFRHFMQLLCGETDEDHAAAVIFNIIAWQTTEYKIAASNALETPEDFDRVAEQILATPSPTAALTRDLSANLRDPMREPQGPNEVEPDGSDCEPRFNDPVCRRGVDWADCTAKGCKRSSHHDWEVEPRA